ncbi:hypothetical protein JCM8547_008652 [Rhodosporidiobolus lusitaniae]
MPWFTDLPPERLEEICELLYEDHPKQYLGAVSKLFVPFSRQLVFSKIRVETYQRLEQLCNLVGADYRRHLTSLEKLTVRGRGVSPPTNASYLPALSHLVYDPFPENRPFDPSPFRDAWHYRRLSCLYISYPFKVSRERSQLPTHNPPGPLVHLHFTRLSLSGHLREHPDVLDLIASCSSLVQLMLTTSDGSSSRVLPDLLHAVTYPATLKTALPVLGQSLPSPTRSPYTLGHLATLNSLAARYLPPPTSSRFSGTTCRLPSPASSSIKVIGSKTTK